MEIFNRFLDPSTPFFLIINKLFLTLRKNRVGTESDYREREKNIWHFVNSDLNFRACKVNFQNRSALTFNNTFSALFVDRS